LPAPDGGAYAARGYEAPVDEIETTLAEVWAELLQVERVGRHDHFFELGGHSLLAVTLIERLRQRGMAADVRALFAGPTLKDFAATLRGESGSLVGAPPNGIPAQCGAITPEMLSVVQLKPGDIESIVRQV